jgi:hypothetical protein
MTAPKPSSSFPEWVDDFENYQDQVVKLQEALAIAWEALERVRTQPHDNIRGYAYEALRRIREIGGTK